MLSLPAFYTLWSVLGAQSWHSAAIVAKPTHPASLTHYCGGPFFCSVISLLCPTGRTTSSRTFPSWRMDCWWSHCLWKNNAGGSSPSPSQTSNCSRVRHNFQASATSHSLFMCELQEHARILQPGQSSPSRRMGYEQGSALSWATAQNHVERGA